MSKEKEAAVSDFNEATYQLLRLHELYLKANSESKKGNYVEWNWTLDNIWRELAPDAIHADEFEYKKKYLDHCIKVYKSWEDKKLLYVELQNKEIFLRTLQDKVGKGTRRSERYEQIM